MSRNRLRWPSPVAPSSGALICVVARVQLTWHWPRLPKVEIRKSPGASGNARSVVTLGGVAAGYVVATPRVTVVCRHVRVQLPGVVGAHRVDVLRLRRGSRAAPAGVLQGDAEVIPGLAAVVRRVDGVAARTRAG